MNSSKRLAALLIVAVAGSILAIFSLDSTVLSQAPEGSPGLPAGGEVSTQTRGTFTVEGAFELEAVDVTAGELIMIGDFGGGFRSADGVTTSVAAEQAVLPVVGVTDQCAALRVDVSNVFIDSLGFRLNGGEVLLDLAPVARLADSLCWLVAILYDGAPGSLDEAVSRVSELLSR